MTVNDWSEHPGSWTGNFHEQRRGRGPAEAAHVPAGPSDVHSWGWSKLRDSGGETGRWTGSRMCDGADAHPSQPLMCYKGAVTGRTVPDRTGPEGPGRPDQDTHKPKCSGAQRPPVQTAAGAGASSSRLSARVQERGLVSDESAASPTGLLITVYFQHFVSCIKK